MSKKKIGELGAYDIFETKEGWFGSYKIHYELNYDRLDLEKICVQYREALEKLKGEHYEG